MLLSMQICNLKTKIFWSASYLIVSQNKEKGDHHYQLEKKTPSLHTCVRCASYTSHYIYLYLQDCSGSTDEEGGIP